jgi:N6-L-threonylcarbamoyladenine synthase
VDAKNKSNIILGIDTSCYTTSIAAISLDKSIILNEKILLRVKENTKGIRQSEGVFQHINNLGYNFEKIKDILSNYNIVAVCVSTKPRPVKDSYMPVFLAGYNYAKTIASVLNIPLYETTHQENHIEASLYNSYISKKEFISVHMSGGTTEILKVSKNGHKYNIDIIGGSKDISFGQLIDRIGVSLGYDFPCGKYVDEKALSCIQIIEEGLKTSVKDGYMNISGLENQIYKIMNDFDDYYICKLTLDSIVRIMYKSLIYLCDKYNMCDVVFAGGVSASKYIKNNLTYKLKKHKINCYFTKPDYATDNALGCSLTGLQMYLGDE